MQTLILCLINPKQIIHDNGLLDASAVFVVMQPVGGDEREVDVFDGFIQPQRYNFYPIWLNKKFYSAKIMCFCIVLAGLIFLFSQNKVVLYGFG